MRIPLIKPNPPAFEEISKHLEQSYEQSWFSNGGPAVQKLTKRYRRVTGSENITLVNNATMGLTVLLRSLIGDKGGKVLIPSFTFPATALAVESAGYEPVLLDIDSDLAMDLEKTRQVLSQWNNDKQIKAIIPVFPLGYDIASEKYRKVAKEFGVACIFDAAACLGMREIKGNVVYSLHITKTNGIGEGGIIQAENGDIHDSIQEAINFGMDNDETVRWGTNAKMSEFQAAVGLASIRKSKSVMAKKKSRFARYVRELKVSTHDRPNGYQVMPIFTANRDQLQEYLSDHGIATKVYYKSLHQQEYFKGLEKHFDPKTSYCEFASKVVLCIPLFDTMTLSKQTYIIERINEFTGE